MGEKAAELLLKRFDSDQPAEHIMKTIVVQRSEARRKTAEKLGADRTVDPRERSWVDQVM